MSDIDPHAPRPAIAFAVELASVADQSVNSDAMTISSLPSTIVDPSGWEQATYAFLAEKHRRSGSMRTVQSYSRMLKQFFGQVGTTPDKVRSADVLSCVHCIGLSGRTPSSCTIGARVGCISSFDRFLIRMDALHFNPCDALERPKVQPRVARGYSARDVRRRLAFIPDSVAGRRDSGHHPHVGSHRQAPRGSHLAEGREHHRRRRQGVLRLSRQGREDWAT